MLGSRLNTLHDVTLPQIQTMEEEIRKQHVRNELRDKINLIDTLLGSMTPPELTLTQGQEYDDNINSVTELINSAKLFLFDVKTTHENTRPKEINKLTNSLKRIEHRVASINVTLCRLYMESFQNPTPN